MAINNYILKLQPYYLEAQIKPFVYPAFYSKSTDLWPQTVFFSLFFPPLRSTNLCLTRSSLSEAQGNAVDGHILQNLCSGATTPRTSVLKPEGHTIYKACTTVFLEPA